ncbi:MAG: RidA family protein [Dongiaceae bacterium]
MSPRQVPITRYHTNPAFTSAPDLYSDGAAIEGTPRVLHASGQVGIRGDGTTSADFAEQCEQALTNLLAVLAAADMKPENVVKLTCFVVGSRPLAALYDARKRFLPNVGPAATTVIVQGLAAPEWLIEIEAIAAA